MTSSDRGPVLRVQGPVAGVQGLGAWESVNKAQDQVHVQVMIR